MHLFAESICGLNLKQLLDLDYYGEIRNGKFCAIIVTNTIDCNLLPYLIIEYSKNVSQSIFLYVLHFCRWKNKDTNWRAWVSGKHYGLSSSKHCPSRANKPGNINKKHSNKYRCYWSWFSQGIVDPKCWTWYHYSFHKNTIMAHRQPLRHPQGQRIWSFKCLATLCTAHMHLVREGAEKSNVSVPTSLKEYIYLSSRKKTIFSVDLIVSSCQLSGYQTIRTRILQRRPHSSE